MTGRRGALMWGAGAVAGTVVGLLLVMVTGPATPWIPVAAASAGWLAAVAASRDREWAPTAAVAGALNIWALFLMASRGVTSVTSVLAIIAIAASTLHVLRMLQRRRRLTAGGTLTNPSHDVM